MHDAQVISATAMDGLAGRHRRRLCAAFALCVWPFAASATVAVPDSGAVRRDAARATLHTQTFVPWVQHRPAVPSGAGGALESASSNDVVLNARRREGEMAVQARFIGAFDAASAPTDTDDATRVKGLYADVHHGGHPVRARLGRQVRSSGGVLGRFDGAMLSYRLQPALRMNAVHGYPVDSSTQATRTERVFHGVSADLGTADDAWNFVAFVMEQERDGALERRAVGGEVRYTDLAKSMFSFVDYDARHGRLNTLLLLASWKLPAATTLHAAVDLRDGPMLGSYNAIQGRGRESVEVLRTRFDENAVLQDSSTNEENGDVYSAALGKRLNAFFELTGDLAYSESGPDNGPRDTQNSYGLQLLGKNVFGKDETAAVGLNYADSPLESALSLAIDGHYPVSRTWSLSPRLRIDRRQGLGDDALRTFGVSVDLACEPGKQQRFQLQTGGEWADASVPDAAAAARGVHLQAAYELAF